MRYKEFMENVKGALEKKLLGRKASVEINRVVKSNDQFKDSISIIEPGRCSSPTVYLNDFYEWHMKGGSIDEISDKILEIFDRSMNSIPEEFLRFDDFDEARGNITLKVLNTAINEAYLEDTARIEYLDLSVVFYCTAIVGLPAHVYCSKISKELMRSWGTDEHTLYDLARQNTPRLLGVYLREVKDVILEMIQGTQEEVQEPLLMALEDEDRSPMYILSNCTHNSGAGNIFSEGILKSLAEQLDGDLYLIPSSVHEVLVLPVNSRLTREDVDAMVSDVNRTVLRPEDILSDHVYIYKRQEDRIIM